jgi:hypothetical protein
LFKGCFGLMIVVSVSSSSKELYTDENTGNPGA